MDHESKLEDLKKHPEKLEILAWKWSRIRDFDIFCSFYSLNDNPLTKEELAKKHNLSPQRINGIIKDIWNFIDLPVNSKFFKGGKT